MKTLLILCVLFQPPVITKFHKGLTLGQIYNLERYRKADAREHNFWRWIERYDKGYEERWAEPPWYIRERVKEYLENR